MTARQSLQVGSTNVEGLRLSPQPGTTIQGRMRVEARNSTSRFDSERVFLALQSVDSEQDEGVLPGRENFSNLAHVAPDGSFQWTDVPAGSYYVQVMGDTTANEGWFVKSVAAGGRDINESGISVDGGTVTMDLVITANGGVCGWHCVRLVTHVPLGCTKTSSGWPSGRETIRPNAYAKRA